MTEAAAGKPTSADVLFFCALEMRLVPGVKTAALALAKALDDADDTEIQATAAKLREAMGWASLAGRTAD